MGLGTEAYFQKQAPKGMPPWIPTRTFRTFPRAGEPRMVDFPLVGTREALQWMVQMNCIDMNAWYSRVDKPERPDYVVFDLDPPDGEFALCIRAAHLLHELLESLELRSYVKTSGADGIHVLVPVARRYGFGETYAFAEAVSRRLEDDNPGGRDDGVAEEEAAGRPARPPPERARQDARVGLLRAAEAGRAGLDAAPLGRATVDGSTPRDFTMAVALERVEQHGDLFEPTLRGGQSLGAARKLLGDQESRAGEDLATVCCKVLNPRIRRGRSARPAPLRGGARRESRSERGGASNRLLQSLLQSRIRDDRSRDALRVLRRLAEQAAQRRLQRGEVEARCAGMRLAAMHERRASPVEHAELADERLRARAEARRGDRPRRPRAASRPTSTTTPSSTRSTAATTSTRPFRTASTKPTSMIGTVPVRPNCAIPSGGAGSPNGSRSGIEIFLIARVIGTTVRLGNLPSAIPSSCVGTPSVSRRTTIGGVRTLSRTRAAPPSARSVAISAPEFPEPTTSTSLPEYGRGST